MTRHTRTLFAVAAAGLLAVPVSAVETVSPQTSLVNEELARAWKAAELKPSKKASDYEFVRRAFIDIVGRIPTAEEVAETIAWLCSDEASGVSGQTVAVTLGDAW